MATGKALIAFAMCRKSAVRSLLLRERRRTLVLAFARAHRSITPSWSRRSVAFRRNGMDTALYSSLMVFSARVRLGSGDRTAARATCRAAAAPAGTRHRRHARGGNVVRLRAGPGDTANSAVAATAGTPTRGESSTERPGALHAVRGPNWLCRHARCRGRRSGRRCGVLQVDRYRRRCRRESREARWTSGAIGRAEVTVFVNDGMGGTSTSSISVEMLAPENLVEAPRASSTPTTDALSKALNVYQLGRFEEALQAFTQAQRLDPSEPDAYYYIGEIYLRQGNVSGAIREFERYLILAGRNSRPEAARLLAVARAMRAQIPEPEKVPPPAMPGQPLPRPAPPHPVVPGTGSGSQRPPVTAPPDDKGPVTGTGAEPPVPYPAAPAGSAPPAANAGPPPATPEIAPSLTPAQPFQWVLLAMGGSLFLIVVTAAVFIPTPTPFQQSVFRTALALGASMIAASIPWFVGNVGGSAQTAGLAVGGALGVFMLVFFVDPVTRLHVGAATALPLVSSAVKAPAGFVFISYRRAERLDLVDRLHERLESRLGAGTVFKDVSDIKPGQKFRDVLADALHQCRVALIIIGPEWERMRNANGVAESMIRTISSQWRSSRRCCARSQ